ncbi:uncharacterized protein K452DRAFT_154286 [Aplosporella prunicola CBS 121167]|uniref:Uncharacterized protein n=1 Tax=Aplosporella prunicola CBS 121167 TaxID=1176127 RepID=A0A6A6BJ39_9PEZI|nr:uncharacterized protein K452DRAFT_154286 [Aplosporella prunicola CBS 121167]KAF2144170.1 hypothetical protein K452DRAFT_154286 [Aplosporella prunicola CBS 121167]
MAAGHHVRSWTVVARRLCLEGAGAHPCSCNTYNTSPQLHDIVLDAQPSPDGSCIVPALRPQLLLCPKLLEACHVAAVAGCLHRCNSTPISSSNTSSLDPAPAPRGIVPDGTHVRSVRISWCGWRLVLSSRCPPRRLPTPTAEVVFWGRMHCRLFISFLCLHLHRCLPSSFPALRHPAPPFFSAPDCYTEHCLGICGTSSNNGRATYRDPYCNPTAALNCISLTSSNCYGVSNLRQPRSDSRVSLWYPGLSTLCQANEGLSHVPQDPVFVNKLASSEERRGRTYTGRFLVERQDLRSLLLELSLRPSSRTFLPLPPAREACLPTALRSRR